MLTMGVIVLFFISWMMVRNGGRELLLVVMWRSLMDIVRTVLLTSMMTIVLMS